MMCNATLLDDLPKGARLDSKGKVQLTRQLPPGVTLDDSLVPTAIIRLREAFLMGRVELLSRTKRHTAMGRLRKYHMAPAAKARTPKSGMTPAERREYDCRYLRQWRAQQAAA